MNVCKLGLSIAMLLSGAWLSPQAQWTIITVPTH